MTIRSDDPILLLIGQLVQAENLCMAKYLLTPALILMYSTIDILASLDMDLQDYQSTRARFEQWITSFFPSVGRPRRNVHRVEIEHELRFIHSNRKRLFRPRNR